MWKVLLVLCLFLGTGHCLTDFQKMRVLKPSIYYLNITISDIPDTTDLNYTVSERIVFAATLPVDEILLSCNELNIKKFHLFQDEYDLNIYMQVTKSYCRFKRVNDAEFETGNYSLVATVSGNITDNSAAAIFYSLHSDHYTKLSSYNIIMTSKPGTVSQFIICFDDISLLSDFHVIIINPSNLNPFIFGRGYNYQKYLPHYTYSEFEPIRDVPVSTLNLILTPNVQKTDFGDSATYSVVAGRNYKNEFPSEFSFLHDIFREYFNEYEHFKHKILPVTDLYWHVLQNYTGSWTTDDNLCLMPMEYLKLFPRNLNEIHNFIARCMAKQHLTMAYFPSWWNVNFLAQGIGELYSFRFRLYHGAYQRYTSFDGLDGAYMESFRRDEEESPNFLGFFSDNLLDYGGDFNAQKAACLINMLKHVIRYDKDETFDKIIAEFTKRTNSVYNLFDFEQLFRKHTQEIFPQNYNVSDFIASWIYQRGYPIVTADRIANRIKFSQGIFSPRNNWRNVSLFMVPVSIVMARNWHADINATHPTIWLLPRDRFVYYNMNPYENLEWFVANNQRTGYYRVKYDDFNYYKLLQELCYGNLTKISRVTRAQLLDDTLFLARHNLVRYDHAIDMLECLERDIDYVPWQEVQRELRNLERNLRFTNTYPLFKRFMKIISRHFYRAHVEEPDGIAVPKWAIVWACFGGLRHCLNLTQYQLQDYLKRNLIVEELETVLCQGMKTIDWETFNYLMMSLNFVVDVEQWDLNILAMGCLENRRQLNALLNVIFRSHLKQVGRSKINLRIKRRLLLQIIDSSETGAQTLLDYIHRHPHLVYQNAGSSLTGILEHLSQSLYTRTQQRKLRRIMDFLHLHDANDIWENVNVKYKWIKMNLDDITRLLAMYQIIEVDDN